MMVKIHNGAIYDCMKDFNMNMKIRIDMLLKNQQPTID